jgi:hypothetical protein
MAFLRSQKLEVSAAFFVTLTSLTAGLVGLAIGRSEARRSRRRRRTVTPEAGAQLTRDTGPSWQTLSDVETTLGIRDRELRELRRSYELDTGLLKEEILRLTHQLADTGRVPPSSGQGTVVSEENSEERSESTSGRGRSIHFSSIIDLVGGRHDPGSG